jgi:hypothetical protein
VLCCLARPPSDRQDQPPRVSVNLSPQVVSPASGRARHIVNTPDCGFIRDGLALKAFYGLKDACYKIEPSHHVTLLS